MCGRAKERMSRKGDFNRHCAGIRMPQKVLHEECMPENRSGNGLEHCAKGRNNFSMKYVSKIVLVP
jgi:hypothetical protein